MTIPAFDGPRQIFPFEHFDSERLAKVCFGSDDPAAYLAQAGRNQDQPQPVPPHGEVYVVTAEGKLVSQIGIYPEEVQLYNGLLRIGSIGGVCTHPHYREHRLASQLLQRCTERLVEIGSRLLFISGERGLYLRHGNVLAGRFSHFQLEPGQLDLPPRTAMRHPVNLRHAHAGDAALFSRLYATEPVRFRRKMAFYTGTLGEEGGYIAKEKWVAEVDGQPLAYLLLGEPYERGEPGTRYRYLAEYAGSRLALAAAVGEILAQPGVNEIDLFLPWQDADFIAQMQSYGVEPQPAYLGGHSMRVINFPGLQSDLHPYIESRLDASLRRGMRFEQSGPLLAGAGGDRLAIVRGADRLELDGAEMTRLVMGAPGYTPPQVSGALGEIIGALFPLPAFLPGMNYH